MSEDLQGLYEEAMQAVKAGDKEKARNLLQQVVEEDEENVDAWVALSKVVDNDAERRICLTTILQLDSGNAYARKALAKSEEKIELGKNEEEVAPGITRKMVRTAAIGSAVYILIVFGITMMIVSGINGGKSAERAQLTKIASDLVSTADAIVTGNANIAATQTMQSITATAQARLLITPSATFTNTPDTRFPTWTPTPDEAVSSNFRVLELPPANMPGFIFGWGGRDATNSGYVDPFKIPANGLESKQEIINELARSVTSDVPGQTILFERFNRRLGETALVVMNPNDADNTITGFPALFSSANVTDIQNPSLSSDGSKFVVDALVSETGLREVFFVDIRADTITQITSDGANYTTPRISQDGTRILAVRQDPANGTDLMLIDIVTLNQIPMTNDGDALIESSPSWHRDGAQAVYSAHPAGQPNSGEIYLLRILPEQGTSILLIATADDESHPVFDPSSQFIAFASNRGTGIYNIYIFDITGLVTYQLTEAEFNHYPGGWSLN